MKKILLRLFYFGNNPPDKIAYHQKIIRDIEWAAIIDFIKVGSTFLDIGAGSGYSMKRAQHEKDCVVYGIDPVPGIQGADRKWNEDYESSKITFEIIEGYGEHLPFEDSKFDTVFSSHAFEHADNETQFLMEAKRVTKDDATLIIGMPTASMAGIYLISSILFTTHQKWANFILSRLKVGNAPRHSLRETLIPSSHSYANKSVFYDMKHYKIKNWEKIIGTHFNILQTIKPALYPYPDFIQLFKLRKNSNYSSSVFFICKKH